MQGSRRILQSEKGGGKEEDEIGPLALQKLTKGVRLQYMYSFLQLPKAKEKEQAEKNQMATSSNMPKEIQDPSRKHLIGSSVDARKVVERSEFHCWALGAS